MTAELTTSRRNEPGPTHRGTIGRYGARRVCRDRIVRIKLEWLGCPALVLLAAVIAVARRSPVPPLVPAAPATPPARIGPIVAVSQAPFANEPTIAADPTNPRRLAVNTIEQSPPDCPRDTMATCIHLGVYISADGGATWSADHPFGTLEASVDPQIGFGPDGVLHVVGISSTAGDLLEFHYSFAPDGSWTRAGAVITTKPTDKDWLTIDPRTGVLYVAYTGTTSDNFATQGLLLQSSADGGRTWSSPVVVDRGVDTTAWQNNQAIPPYNAQVLLGATGVVSVVWNFSPGFDQVPWGVWIATSNDGGATFGAPRRIADTWTPATTAMAARGVAYVVYRRGTLRAQQLVAAISRDGGQTWETSVVSGDVPLQFDVDKAPGVGIAPDGTVDVLFYARSGGVPACLLAGMAQLRNTPGGWVDHCTYNVYYTFSRDGGRSFARPVRVNSVPIQGERFPRWAGRSHPGDYVGMASTDRFAQPVWIDTLGSAGAQAVTTRIER